MRYNLAKSMELIFGHEGGFTLDRRDPGNWTGGQPGRGTLKGTKFGIAASSHPHVEIQRLTLADATAIYESEYAAKICFDDLPSGVDYATLDFAIHSGPHKAAIVLQRVVHAAEDGKIGPLTLQAISEARSSNVISMLCFARLHFLQSLSTWPNYRNGWTRRVEEVRGNALAMAAEA
jgi:lysozyme family protein